MDNLRWIVRDIISCWYELSFQQEPAAIILRIHQDFIENFLAKVKNPPEEWPIVKSFLQGLGFTGFSGDFQKDIGFESLLKRKGEKDGFIEFLAVVPEVEKESGKKCRDCRGLGKKYGSECFMCRGTGKECIMDWRLADAISASFSVFTTVLHNSSNQKDTSAPFPQLLTVDTTTSQGMDGGSLSGEVSIPLCNWLIGLKENALFPEVSQATKAAYYHMFLNRCRLDYYFRAYVRENGRFIIDCPGDACGLHPCDWDATNGNGYEFTCYNVDTSAQQITLLAGLAALHDKARKEMQP